MFKYIETKNIASFKAFDVGVCILTAYVCTNLYAYHKYTHAHIHKNVVILHSTRRKKALH